MQGITQPDDFFPRGGKNKGTVVHRWQTDMKEMEDRRNQALNVTRMIRTTVTKKSMLFDFIV